MGEDGYQVSLGTELVPGSDNASLDAELLAETASAAVCFIDGYFTFGFTFRHSTSSGVSFASRRHLSVILPE